MSGRGRRTLAPEEAALWQRVVASVTPIHGRAGPQKVVASSTSATPNLTQLPTPPVPTPIKIPVGKLVPVRRTPAAITLTAPATVGHAGNTLDKSWDRRLSRGLVAPESTVDLHGHTLHSAYDRLDFGLAQAVARGDRVLLLITGKPPRPESERPHARGSIRAAVGDWLASSRHADRIAAVRQAHPRHGGAGALYIVLRRHRQ